jgi:hypothetical protein
MKLGFGFSKMESEAAFDIIANRADVAKVSSITAAMLVGQIYDQRDLLPGAPNPQASTPNTSLTSECSLCLERPPTIAMIPCGHVCVCAENQCRTKLSGRCFVCRGPVTGTLRVYLC